MYNPRKVVKGKHYAVYSGTKIPTKSALLQKALKKALGVDYHADFIDFIPARFTLQVHGWFDPGTYKNLADIRAKVNTMLGSGGDPGKELKDKWHYDLRVQKKASSSWFGMTMFRAPWKGTQENKVLGTVKGYQSLVKGGKELQKFLIESASKAIATEGVRERQDKLEWMKIKNQWFPKDSPGNPQKNEEAAMLAIEFNEPAVLHRRQYDFIDVTFLGKHLKGRYYYRLVEREAKDEEKTKWQKEKGGKTFVLNFYFWKAKDQFSEAEMSAIAAGRKSKNPMPAPPSKSK